MPVGYSIYVETGSKVHDEIDPRTKMLALLALFILSIAFNHPLVLGLLVIGIFTVGLWARLSFRKLAPFLVFGVGWVFIPAILIWPFYIDQGRPLFEVFGRVITFDGLLYGLAMGLRVALMVISAGVWMMTTSPEKMTVGLLKMGLPYKAGLAISNAIRFVPLINAQISTIREAQRARGLQLEKGNPFSRAIKYLSVLGPVFLRSVDLIQSLAIAMDARGFGAGNGRTTIIQINMKRLDWLIVTAFGIAVAVGLLMRVLGIGVLIEGYL